MRCFVVGYVGECVIVCIGFVVYTFWYCTYVRDIVLIVYLVRHICWCVRCVSVPVSIVFVELCSLLF